MNSPVLWALAGLATMLAVLPFVFVAGPTVKRLVLLLSTMAAFILVSALWVPQGRDLLLTTGLIYSLGAYFVLSFFLQNNIRLFYAGAVGFDIGFDEFAIPLALWQWTDEFRFLTFLGVPVWHPLSYIRMLRTYHREITSEDFSRGHHFPGMVPGETRLAISACRFRDCVAADATKKDGDCFLVFTPSSGELHPILGFASREIMKIKASRKHPVTYKLDYIDRLAFALKLNTERLYDVLGTFSALRDGNSTKPVISVRAVVKHHALGSPYAVLLHWATCMFFLALFVALAVTARLLQSG